MRTPCWLCAVAAVAALPSPAPAQVAAPVQALLDKAAKLDSGGKTGEATAEIEAAVKLAARTAPNSESHAAALAMLAEFLAGFDAKRALALAEQSAAIRTTLYGADDMRTLRERQVVALLKGITGDVPGEVAMLGEVLGAMERAAATQTEREEVGVARAAYAMTLVKTGDETRARAEAAAAAAVFDGPPAVTSATSADAYFTIAGLELRWGSYASAVAHTDTAIAIGKREKGPTSPDLIQPMRYRAEALLRLGRFAESEGQFREALAIADAATPPIFSIRFALMKSLGRLYMFTGRYDLASRVLDQSVTLVDALEKDSSLRVTAHSDRSLALQLAGRLAPAEEAAQAALDAARTIEPGRANNASTALRLATLLIGRGRIDEARPLVNEGVAILAKTYPEGRWERAAGDVAIGDLAAAAGDQRGAAVAYRRAVDLLSRNAAQPLDKIDAAFRAGRALAGSGDVANGWPLSRQSADWLTGQVVERGAAPTASATLSPNEDLVFASALDVAWQRVGGRRAR